MRHVLTDEEWDQLQPLLPSEKPRRGRPWVSHRLVVSGIFWLLATGVPWRDLPEEFGKWKTVFNRFRRWVREDVWDDLLAAFYRQRDAEGFVDREQWNVDGTNIRAHRCAGGATNSDPLEPEDHGLGYSKGGFGTKLHVVVEGRQMLLNVIGTPGQTHESTQFETVLETVPLTQGKTRMWPQSVAGDKGYSGKKNRTWLKRRRIEDVIASKTNEARDPEFDKDKYRRRNVVERAIGWLKEKRRIATRYEKKIRHFLAIVKIGIIRWLLKLDLRDRT
jgi:transposase